MNEIIVPQGKPTMETQLKDIVLLDYEIHMTENTMHFAIYDCAEYHPRGCECTQPIVKRLNRITSQYAEATGFKWQPKDIQPNWIEHTSVKDCVAIWWTKNYTEALTFADVMPAGELVWS